ncbi:MAG: hypothetical protein AAF633_18860 [Chloroflexota bacterium]
MFGIADIYALFFIVITMLLTFPGMIGLLKFGLPKLADRAEERIGKTPWFTLGTGFFLGGSGALTVAGLASAGGPAAGIAVILAVLLITISFMGGAGLATLLGQRMFEGTFYTNPFKAFLMGTLAYEFALFFPVIGWFLFLPILILFTFGAGMLALLRWRPHAAESQAVEGIVIRNS